MPATFMMSPHDQTVQELEGGLAVLLCVHRGGFRTQVGPFYYPESGPPRAGCRRGPNTILELSAGVGEQHGGGSLLIHDAPFGPV